VVEEIVRLGEHLVQHLLVLEHLVRNVRARDGDVEEVVNHFADLSKHIYENRCIIGRTQQTGMCRSRNVY